ncbi:ATP-binding protein [Patescibacteria group bacterium]|nr:ATP-binding protein [Patescibacteria group bacterium]
MENYIKENKPNAAKFINSLRSAGYDNYDAILDIVDNSLDAKATKVYISIKPTVDDFQLTIADNGIGMSEKVLDEAMRLGSDTERNEDNDLGKFGMGLVTAFLSIGRKLTVITNKDGDFYTSIQDVDEIERTNEFVKELRKSTREEEDFYKEVSKNKKSGTVIKIEKCDNIQNTNINEFVERLNKKIGQTFRYFLSKCDIYIRGDKVEKIDPLMLDNKETEVFSEDYIDIATESGKEEKLGIKIVLLPSFDSSLARLRGINMANQGFYIIRNNREIASGETLKVFDKHNDFNRVRIELILNGKLDKTMGVTFKKESVKPKEEIIREIKKFVKPQLETIRRSIKKEQQAKNKDSIDHNPSLEVISKKQSNLIIPEILIEKRDRSNLKSVGSVDKKESGRERNPKETQRRMMRPNLEWQYKSLSKMGPFFEVDQVGKKLIITYNIDHPFYANFLEDQKDNQEVVNAIDFMVYSLATARQTQVNDENIGLIENIFAIFFANLKTLLSDGN